MAVPSNGALLIVDMQIDFCPGGALPVSGGDEIVPRLNSYIGLFRKADRPILACRDWHPEQTTHFVTQGGAWPPHCVQGTEGAAFHPYLLLPGNALIVSKGMGADEEAYSAFEARDDEGRSLVDNLHALQVQYLYVGGLALDYCVKASALDAAREGFSAILLIDATRAVNLDPHDAELAIEELVRWGVQLATFEALAR